MLLLNQRKFWIKGKYTCCPWTLQAEYSEAERLAVLTMIPEGIDQKELDKIDEKFIDEIDNSQISMKISLMMILFKMN
jgi:hypothetical protein